MIDPDALPMSAIDLHVHSVASGHAFGTLAEIVRAAERARLESVGLADHGPNMVGAPHAGFFRMGEDVRRSSTLNVVVMFGCEANVLSEDGAIDIDFDVASGLDYVIAGLHRLTSYDRDPTKRADKARNTAALVAAIESGLVDIISHPVTETFPVDVQELVRAATLCGVALEVNSRALAGMTEAGLESYRHMISLCADAQCSLVLSSDAHTASDVGVMGGAEQVLDASRLPTTLLRDQGTFIDWIAGRHGRTCL